MYFKVVITLQYNMNSSYGRHQNCNHDATKSLQEDTYFLANYNTSMCYYLPAIVQYSN